MQQRNFWWRAWNVNQDLCDHMRCLANMCSLLIKFWSLLKVAAYTSHHIHDFNLTVTGRYVLNGIKN